MNGNPATKYARVSINGDKAVTMLGTSPNSINL